MKRTLVNKDSQKCRVICKCGHTLFVTNKRKFKICNWCGRKVFLHKEDEFKDKLLKEMKK